jgi:hypothetical protein
MKISSTIIVPMPYGEACVACPDCGYKFLREGAAFDTEIAAHNCKLESHRLQDENIQLREILRLIIRNYAISAYHNNLIEEALRSIDRD